MKSEEAPSILLLLLLLPSARYPASLARIPRVRHKCSASPNDELQPRTPDKWTNIVRLPLAIKHLAGMGGKEGIHYRSWRVTIRSLDEGNAKWIRNEASPIRRGCSIVPSRAFYKRILPRPSLARARAIVVLVVDVVVVVVNDRRHRHREANEYWLVADDGEESWGREICGTRLRQGTSAGRFVTRFTRDEDRRARQPFYDLLAPFPHSALLVANSPRLIYSNCAPSTGML